MDLGSGMTGSQKEYLRLYTSGRAYDSTYNVYQVNNLRSWPFFIFLFSCFACACPMARASL